MIEVFDTTIVAKDKFALAATLYGPQTAERIAVINSATAVPRRFYRFFAEALAARGWLVVTYDYRGTGGSRPASLRGFEARVRDWAMLDMQGVVDWARARRPDKLVFLAHSIGGQIAGLLEDPAGIDGLLTFSSQSGYWRLQGGAQKMMVGFHVHVTLPGAAKLFGYVPWSKFAGGEDLPKGVGLEWARWCRQPNYLFDDDTLPLTRYGRFPAPVLAYSFDDDDWGTKQAVDAMMQRYPKVERRHVRARDTDVSRIGHFGYFRQRARPLWDDAFAWLDTR